jgi:hypothetical protein
MVAFSEAYQAIRRAVATDQQPREETIWRERAELRPALCPTVFMPSEIRPRTTQGVIVRKV